MFPARSPILLLAISACLLSVWVFSCDKKPSAPLTEAQALFERGKIVYQANCIACHNSDPSKAGSVGPAIRGSSKELIEARILHAAYPPGYQPKRDTHLMPPLPHLAKDIEALARFLSAE